jgi:putative hemolysin
LVRRLDPAPLIILLNGSGAFLLRLLGLGHGGGHQHVHSPEEIQLLIRQSYQGGLLDERGQELLNNAFRIGDLNAAAVAVPRTQMATLAADTAVREALRFTVDSGHTRIPVYEQDVDHIVGFVHVKDLFQLYKATPGAGAIGQIVRKASFVPETAPLDEVWNQLKKDQNYLAIVLDEFGGTVGMITWEDLLEELFGELRDEFDEAEEPLITPAGAHEYLIRGETPIAYLNSRFELALPAGQVHSAGGLVISLLNRLPEVGDTVDADGVALQVEAVRDRAPRRSACGCPRQTPRREVPADGHPRAVCHYPHPRPAQRPVRRRRVCHHRRAPDTHRPARPIRQSHRPATGENARRPRQSRPLHRFGPARHHPRQSRPRYVWRAGHRPSPRRAPP